MSDASDTSTNSGIGGRRPTARRGYILTLKERNKAMNERRPWSKDHPDEPGYDWADYEDFGVWLKEQLKNEYAIEQLENSRILEACLYVVFCELNKEKDLLRRQCVDPKYCVGRCKTCGDKYYPETVYLQCPLCFGKEIDRLKSDNKQLWEQWQYWRDVCDTIETLLKGVNDDDSRRIKRVLV
jgi:hypothetical protein